MAPPATLMLLPTRPNIIELLGLAAGLSRVWPLDSIFKIGEPPHCQQVAQSLDDSLPFVIRSLSRLSLFSVYKPREIADTVLSTRGLREEIGLDIVS